MKSAAVILSFLCLAIVFQFNHGMFCHVCRSRGESNPACNVIRDEEFLKLCNVGQICGEIFFMSKKAPSEIYRLCVNNSLIDTLRQKYMDMGKYGLRVGVYFCDTDACNRRYNLRIRKNSPLKYTTLD